MMGALRASEFDWKGAELEFSRALELDPKSEDVLKWYDHYYLGPMKRLDEAVAAYLRAVEMDPLSPFLQSQLGYNYCLKREWNRAIKQCRNALELDPQGWAYMLLGSCYFHMGKHDDAIRAMETLAQVTGRSSFALGGLGWAYALTGRTGEALKLLEELQERAQKQYVPSWSFAVIYSGSRRDGQSLRLVREGGRRARAADAPLPCSSQLRSAAHPSPLHSPAAEDEPGTLIGLRTVLHNRNRDYWIWHKLLQPAPRLAVQILTHHPQVIILCSS